MASVPSNASCLVSPAPSALRSHSTLHHLTRLRACLVRAGTGAPRSGKTTLVQRISTRNGEAPTEEADSPLDLGMSYSVLEVKEHEASSSGEEGDTRVAHDFEV